jgi:hypothetical protein
MNKTKTNILAALIGILLGSISILAMPGALAQDTSGAQIQVEVESGCSWDGTVYASNLTVNDNEVCVLTGVHNVGAYYVLVQHDADSLGQAGGKLIIGSDTVSTDITFGGTMTMNGILEIGVSGNPATNSNLQIDGTSSISATGSNGDLDIIANTNGNNTIELGSSLTIATSSTSGTFTNNDDATTSTVSSISIYGPSPSIRGLLENLAGTITVTNQIDMYGYGKIDNDGTLTLGNVASYWNNYASADNSGTFNSPNTINIYSGSTITNSGTWNSGTLYFTGSGTSANTGTLNLTTLNFISSGTFNNTGTGDINVTGNIVLNGGGTINNNDTGTVTVDAGTYIYNALSDINNNNSWETDLLQIGLLPSAVGGNFNNYGSLTFPSPAATSINIVNGGDLNNESTGTITVPTDIYMEGASGQVSIITNDNSTNADAIDITGEITMDDYASIDNNGNLTVDGTNNIILGADNGTPETIHSTITNQSSGEINLNGTSPEVFDEDIVITNYGTINRPGSTQTNILDTAYLNNSGGTISISTLGSLNTYDSSGVDNSGSIYAPTIIVADSSTFDQTAGLISSTGIFLNTTTSGEATFTSSGGSVTASSYTSVYDGGTVNNNVLNINGGTWSTGRLNLGIITSINGGIVNIDGTGTLTTTNSGTPSQIYKGTLDIKSTSTAATPISLVNTLNIRGDSSESAYFYMANPNTAEFREIDVYEYGEYRALDGITDLNTYTFYLYGNSEIVNPGSQGLLYIADGGEVSGMYGVYMGNASTRGGKIENYGTLWRGATSNLLLYLYNSADVYNGSTGTIETYNGTIYMFVNEDEPTYGSYSYIENDAGGAINTGNLYTNNTGHVIDNYGSFTVYSGRLGYTNGGTFNNYDTFTFTGGGYLYIENAAEFYNRPDATVSGVASVYVDGASAKYYQAEGTDGATPAVKTSLSAITVTNGLFENADYITMGTLTVNTNGTYNGVLANTFSGAPANDTAQDSITLVNAQGDVTVNGTIKIEGGASDMAAFQVQDTFNINATGVVTIDGTLEMQLPSTNTLTNNGSLYSGNYSTITLVDNPGMNTTTGSFTEIGGTLTATSINMNGGDMCLGDYGDWVGATPPAGPCSNNALDPSKTISNSGTAFDVGGDANVDMYNDLTLTNGNLNVNEASAFEMYGASPLLDVQNNANIIVTGTNSSLYTEGRVDVQGSGTGNHGYLKVESGGGAELAGTTNNIGSFWVASLGSGEASITVDSGATVNLNDTHTDNALVGVITAGVTDINGSEDIYNSGTINMNSGGTQNIYLGADTTTNWNVDGFIGYAGSIQHTNGSTGNLYIRNTGIFYLADDANPDIDGDINGTVTVGANYGHDQNGPHGMYIEGQFRCQTNLTVEDDGLLDVNLTGVVTVAGSTTDVYGDVELDGTLNAGDLTVYSGGIISSGDGGVGAVTGQGCGPSGQFGCGTTTNFYINADSLDVQSGGKIASDGVSESDRDISALAHGGSYAGEGIDSSGSAPESTYGTTKADSPTYGDRGENASDAISALGGGGVEIYVDGDITINGDVTANSGPITYNLAYGSQTADFTIGATLTGPAGTAVIIADNDAGSTGTLTINILSGSFGSGQLITDNAGGAGSATTTGAASVNSGAGAGGTVIITQDLSAAPTTAIFTGSGTISANGGDATYSGGGGRIVIDSILLDNPDFGSYDFGEATAGTVEALGGTDGSSSYAAAGTMVYLGDTHNADDTLIIEQGGNAPTGSTQTDLADSPTFDRIEANNSADADLTGATTQVCYNLNSSSVSGITCNTSTSLPDKPDSLHIETSSNGTSSGDPTEEPGYIAGKGNGVSDTALDVGDITPVFAMYFRNPGDPTGDYNVAEIQVASDASFSTLLWDATVGGTDTPVTLTTAVSDGEWTEDIEYAGDSLSTLTTYYVRARFRQSVLTDPGLWTHADYNDQYKFTISSYTDLWINNCNGVPANTDVVLTQDGTTTGDDMGINSGDRYAYGACDINLSTSESDWEVYMSFATGETGLIHTTNPSYQIDNIDNANNDCLLDNLGTGTEQEFGFNITTYPAGTAAEQLVHSYVNSNSNCRLDTGTYPEACGTGAGEGYYNDTTCFFNVESLATKDTILDTDLGTPSALDNGRYTATFHANAGTFEVAGDYDTVVEVSITTNP